jgi:DNA topoisomerase-3
METLPIIPAEFKYHASERTQDQFKVIKSLLGRDDVTSIVNAADAGREGELIFDLVYTLARCRKPVERLWISSLTRDAIIAGFRQLKPAADYRGLRDSARSRQQADWLVGLNATRAQTIRARGAGHDGVYSLGRVQTPTLALIVSRDEEIVNFVPTNYYEVVADFQSPAGAYRGTWFNKAEVASITKMRLRPSSSKLKASRELLKRSSARRRRNARLCSMISRLCSAPRMRVTVSPPHARSNSRRRSTKRSSHLPAHLFAPSLFERQWGTQGARRSGGGWALCEIYRDDLAKGTPKLTGRHVDDKKVTDHHAIIPAKQRVEPNALQPDEKRIYDLVARRFLAAFYPDAELERTSITTAIEGERFITRGTVVLVAGWREVDPPGREEKKKTDGDDEGDEAELPPVKAKEAVETVKPRLSPSRRKRRRVIRNRVC